MNISTQGQRNFSVFVFSIIAAGALYGIYANWHSVKTNKQNQKLNEEKLKKGAFYLAQK